MKPTPNCDFWVAVGFKKWRGRKLKCLAVGEVQSVFRGRIFNRVINNKDVIAYHKPSNRSDK